VSAGDSHERLNRPARSPDGALPGFTKLDVAGYILAFVLPPAGLVFAVVLLRQPPKPGVRHGRRILVISLVLGVLFVAALIATAHGLGGSEGE